MPSIFALVCQLYVYYLTVPSWQEMVKPIARNAGRSVADTRVEAIRTIVATKCNRKSLNMFSVSFMGYWNQRDFCKPFADRRGDGDTYMVVVGLGFGRDKVALRLPAHNRLAEFEPQPQQRHWKFEINDSEPGRNTQTRTPVIRQDVR